MAFEPAVLGTAHLGNFYLGDYGGYQAVRATAVRIFIAGVTAQTRARKKSLVIRDVLNDAPNTCSFRIAGTPPTVGQDLRITVNSDTPVLLFNGELQSVDLSYDALPGQSVWACTAIDDTARLNRLLPFGIWTTVSATTIAQELIAAFAPGFTGTHIAAGLPSISLILDGTEGMSGALRQIAKAIGGYFYVADLDLHLFQTEATDSPDDLDHTPGRFLDDPKIVVNIDRSQIRTRVYGKGHGVTLLTDVLAGGVIIPIADASMFNAGGGQAITESQILTYTGVQLGGAGSLVGPGAAPSVAPTAQDVAGSGLTSGVFHYAYTWVTAAGESLPGPLQSVTVGAEPTTTVAARIPPATPTISRIATGAAPPVETGNWSAKVTFLYADGTESLPSGASNDVTLTGPNDGILVNLTVGPLGVTGRRIYLKKPSLGVYRFAYDVTNNTSTSQGLSAGVGAGEPPTVEADYPIGGDYIYVTDLSLFSAPGAAAVGAQQLNYSARSGISGVGTLSGVTGIATAISAGATISVYPAGGNQVALSAIAIGPSGTTSRKVYRTVVGGAQLKLQQTIADNTTTTGVQDATADGSLGANVPTSDTSGLTQPSGQVNAGSTTLLTASAGPFASGGGWVQMGGQVVRYTGISGNSLTGIPANGAGAIVTTVLYGSQVIATPALTGVTGVVLALVKGVTVHIWVERNDLAAQAELIALDAAQGRVSDGVVEHHIKDERRGEASLNALCDAELALFSRPIVTVPYASRDTKTKSGKSIVVNLTDPLISQTLTIQEVTIDQIDIADGLAPRFTVSASSVRFSLEDILRKLAV